MKRWPGRNAPRWKHPSPACSGGAAPAPPLSARTFAAALSPPSSQAVPRGTFLAIPAPLPGRPSLRPPGRAGEGRERPREARPPAAGLRVLTQSTRPGPHHLFPPGPPRGWGRLQAAIPLLPRSQVSWPWPSRWPEALTGQTPPRRAATAKAEAGSGAREDPGSCDRPLTRAPRSCPGPSGALSKAGRGRQRRGAAGRRRERRRERVRGADPARPPGVSSAGLSRSGFGAAPRFLSGFRAEGGL